MTSVSSTLDELHKKLFTKMVSGLVKHVGVRDIAIAEDIVQDTFLVAHQQWSAQFPENPDAWLFKVCKNIALKYFRDRKEFLSIEDDRGFEESYDNTDKMEGALSILLSCAHPRFSPRQQLILALRYAAGFRVSEIAAALAAQPETITKTIQRIRLIVAEEKIKLQSNFIQISDQSKNFLLKTLYLMFNEGYKSSQGKSILNLELCEEALSVLQNVLTDKKLCSNESHALYALMLFNLARFEARFETDGELIDLENQDRTRWNSEMIQVATHHLVKSKTRNVSSYHLEATIAYLHCIAPSFQDTQWKKIVSLYEQLLTINESAFVRLNLCIAQFYAGNHDAAKKSMSTLSENFFIGHYYLFHVAYGKMLRQWNKKKEALEHFTIALHQTSHNVEKNYIKKLISAV